jgi:hypothetical protein
VAYTLLINNGKFMNFWNDQERKWEWIKHTTIFIEFWSTKLIISYHVKLNISKCLTTYSSFLYVVNKYIEYNHLAPCIIYKEVLWLLLLNFFVKINFRDHIKVVVYLSFNIYNWVTLIASNKDSMDRMIVLSRSIY